MVDHYAGWSRAIIATPIVFGLHHRYARLMFAHAAGADEFEGVTIRSDAKASVSRRETGAR
jgi:hypothetical protein